MWRRLGRGGMRSVVLRPQRVPVRKLVMHPLQLGVRRRRRLSRKQEILQRMRNAPYVPSDWCLNNVCAEGVCVLPNKRRLMKPVCLLFPSLSLFSHPACAASLTVGKWQTHILTLLLISSRMSHSLSGMMQVWEILPSAHSSSDDPLKFWSTWESWGRRVLKALLDPSLHKFKV